MAMNDGLGDAESLAKCLSEVTPEHHYVMRWCFFDAIESIMKNITKLSVQ